MPEVVPPIPGPLPRFFGRFNGRGLWTLCCRDVLRFLRYYIESLGGPCVSSLLFLAVFALAWGTGGEMVPGVSMAAYIAPGIVVFSLSQAAFQAAAVALIYDKQEGMILDLLAAPLSPVELMLGYTLSAAFNASLVALAVFAMMLIFVDFPVVAPGVALLYVGLTALLFAELGMLVGLWADRWDHFSAAESFLILPLGLLSGSFFTLASLPGPMQSAIEFNPVYHAMNGFRYGLTGYAQGSLLWGGVMMFLLFLVIGLGVWRLLATGYKIKT